MPVVGNHWLYFPAFKPQCCVFPLLSSLSPAIAIVRKSPNCSKSISKSSTLSGLYASSEVQVTISESRCTTSCSSKAVEIYAKCCIPEAGSCDPWFITFRPWNISCVTSFVRILCTSSTLRRRSTLILPIILISSGLHSGPASTICGSDSFSSSVGACVSNKPLTPFTWKGILKSSPSLLCSKSRCGFYGSSHREWP